MMAEKTRIAIVGYGNVGKGVHQAIQANSDMEVSGILTRDPKRTRSQLVNKVNGVFSANLISSIEALAKRTDVAVLCGGSKKDLPQQGPLYAVHFNTVDSFDTHNNIPEYFKMMDGVSSYHGNVAVISAGWDPGTFSTSRVLFDSFIPGAIPKAFYGLTKKGGLSQGHSQAIRTIEGVKDARQYTHAIPEAMEKVRNGENPNLSNREMIWRECQVVLKNDTLDERKRVSEEVKNMENYFAPYETKVNFVSQSDLDKKYSGMPHDGLVLAVGKTGNGNKTTIEYKNVWESNPEATGNVLVACARAAHRLNTEKKIGTYTMLDIPPAYFSQKSHDELLRDFM